MIHILGGSYTKNKRGYISCGSVQVEDTSTWLFKDKKMEEKFDGSFVNKKVVNGRHNDLMEIKECGWDIVCFLKKKWTRFLMHMNCRSKLHDDESS